MTDTVKDILEHNIKKMFRQLVIEYDLETKDITPELATKLRKARELLGEVLGDFVYDNLEEPKDE